MIAFCKQPCAVQIIVHADDLQLIIHWNSEALDILLQSEIFTTSLVAPFNR